MLGKPPWPVTAILFSCNSFLDELWSESSNRALPNVPVSAASEILYNKSRHSRRRMTTNDRSRPRHECCDGYRTNPLVNYAESTDSVSLPLLIVLVLWLAVIFRCTRLTRE